jgi:hypothetical protein
MHKFNALLIILTCFTNISCSYAVNSENSEEINSNGELLEFAKANCFFWYFKKKGYDLKDIRAISGGIVETGSLSPEKYQQVSMLVKEYSPNIQTKQNIDLDLYKCFELSKDIEFLNNLRKIE